MGHGEGHLWILSSQERDSLGSESWREYLDGSKLEEAWRPLEGSPYIKFQKTKTVCSVNRWRDVIKPRYSEGEKTSEIGVDNLIKSGVLDEHTAIVLDSGGAHSVAMAVRLAETLGYQPVVMFDSIPHPKGVNSAEQHLATMLYYAEQMDKLKKEGKIKPTALPVFVCDCHRSELGREGDFDNTYTYDEHDLPSVNELRRLGIKKIVYLNEGDQKGEVREQYQSIDRVKVDLKPIVNQWTGGGIQVLYTGVEPWNNGDRVWDC